MESSLNVSFSLHWGVHTLLKLIRDYTFTTVLDIGSGLGEHKRFLELFQKQVTTCNLKAPANFIGDFLKAPIEGSFDVIWCCHVLEHQRNPGLFLDKIYSLLSEDGVFALCLPRHPAERLVTGHFTTWSLALACQHLVHAGFDCKEIAVFSTYEIGILVKKTPRGLPPSSIVLPWEAIKEYFPSQAQPGSEIGEALMHWGDPLQYSLPRPEGVEGIEIHSKNLDKYPILKPAIQWR
jgi:SAM-dependent methyltransferase